MKSIFLMLALSILVITLNSHGSTTRVTWDKDVPGDYPPPVEVEIQPNDDDCIISVVKYSPDGTLLAIGGVSGIHIYDTQTLGKVSLIKDHKVYGRRIAFSPDGNTLASIILDGREIRLWDVATGTLKQTLRIDSVVGGLRTRDVAFSPDGKTLASCGGYGVYLWDASTGSLLHNLFPERDHGATGVAFSPDGKTLISANLYKTFHFWDVSTGNLLRTLTGEKPHQGIALSPDGKTLASFGERVGIYLWDVSTGHLLHTLNRRNYGRDYLLSVAFSPDGKTLASGSFGAVRLWDVRTGTYLHSMRESIFQYPCPCWSVAFSPDGNTLACGWDGIVRLWNISDAPRPEDINSDGVVNILDLVLVANGFGTAAPDLDLNGDGVVNILDLVRVANAF